MSDPLVLVDEMRCGIVVPGGDRDSIRSYARRAEDAGLDSLWVGDHVSFYIPVVESLSLLAFLAACTERVRLGTSVYLLPLRPPTIAAKISATVDMLSGGRLTLGVGVGGEFPPEFEAVGVPIGERGSRTDESIEILRRLWSEDGVEHSGKHFRFGPISIDPKPAQVGGPAILVGGRRGPAFRRAGRLGDGYISHMTSPDRYRANMDEIRGHASRAGRSDVPFETAAFLFALFDESYDAALDRAATMLERIYNVPFRDGARKYVLLGRPEDCLEKLREFAQAGCRHVIISPLGDSDEALEIAASSILPELPGLLR